MQMLPIKEIAVFDDRNDEAYIVKARSHSQALAFTPRSFRRAMDLDAAREWGYMKGVPVVGELDATEGEAEGAEPTLEELFTKAYELCHD